MNNAPLTDAIMIALARLIDDSQIEGHRAPSHNDIEILVTKYGLQKGDPKFQGQSVGKAKRVRGALSWAIDESPDAGSKMVASLVACVRGHGGFRESSPNFVGHDSIENCASAFSSEGWLLASDGQLQPNVLDGLTGARMTDALMSYVRRARSGSHDGALLVGTGKDLLEATAAHVLQERFNSYSTSDSFPMLLGQAFMALGMKTTADKQVPGETVSSRMERAMYELACSINTLRNKQGTGHGRPFLPTVSDDDARISIQIMGTIAEYMLKRL